MVKKLVLLFLLMVILSTAVFLTLMQISTNRERGGALFATVPATSMTISRVPEEKSGEDVERTDEEKNSPDPASSVASSSSSASVSGEESGATSESQNSEEETSSSEQQPASSSHSLNGVKREMLKQIYDKKSSPNELGEIMIILYHRIGGEDGIYDRSVESFKNDLLMLYQKGYRTVSMSDYLNSSFEVPEGKTPVILTFDDGAVSHFKVREDERGALRPDPDSAVGILEDFYKQHPDFGRHAVFYINSGAFGEPAYLKWKLEYLYENGYEIGNHTFGHESLDGMDADKMQETIGKNAAYYKKMMPSLEMNTLAYPYGNRPKEELTSYALNGVFEGQPYENKIGLIAAWCPVKSLYSDFVSPLEIYRVQAGNEYHQLDWWIEFFEEHPERRFYSDGVKEILTVPESLADELREGVAEQERVLIYKDVAPSGELSR